MENTVIDNRATHRHLVRIAHEVLASATPEQLADRGWLMDLVKAAVGRQRMSFGYSGEIAAALNSAMWQRGHR